MSEKPGEPVSSEINDVCPEHKEIYERALKDMNVRHDKTGGSSPE